MGLSTQEKLLVEQRITNEARNIVVAYLLLIFFGLLGAHRFYMGRTGSGVAMLILTVTMVGLPITVIWAFVDLFLLPGIAREERDAMRQRLITEAVADSEQDHPPPRDPWRIDRSDRSDRDQ